MHCLITARQYLKRLVLIIIAIGFMGVASPAKAMELNQTGGLSKELEQQVLEIIRQHPEVILESVENYRQAQERQQRQQQAEFLQAIKNNPQPFIRSSPTRGAIDPKLLIIEFSDFQCPYCARVHDTLDHFMALHGDAVTLVYKHFPLYQIHPQAMAAARAAWAANRQGKFWPYHDALFAQQDQLSEDLYIQLAADLDLDLEQFNRSRESEMAIASINQDMQLAEELGIAGTPFFVINGEAVSGAIQESFLEEKLDSVY
ncbi:MAG: thioredoxin domain-containing protein [Cyanothece sp. SIO2G6]|nr:thioredoxin domain-containing protein [Cyanothece sp. SIO2G6]